MSENDLSDEAAEMYLTDLTNTYGLQDDDYPIEMAREWRRRAQDNPWQFLIIEELVSILENLPLAWPITHLNKEGRYKHERVREMINKIEAELARRKGDK
jgi:hypothetical protein